METVGKRKSAIAVFIFLFFHFSFIPLLFAAPAAPTSLLTDNQTNPIYIDSPNPSFSWSASTQCYYRVVLATSSDFVSYKWDTGRVTSTVENCDYSGSYLSGNTTYYWKVKVWDVNLSSSVYSSTATFRMNFFIKKGSFGSGQVVSLGRGDFDGDGKIDLALGTSGKSSLTEIYKNWGNWNFSTTTYSAQYGLDIGGVVVKDLNKDGLPDLITGVQIDNNGTNTASQIFVNDGNFNFHETASLNKKKTGSITTFDINRDGNYDIIEGLFSDGPAGEYNVVYMGNGDGTFAAGKQIGAPDNAYSNNTRSIAVADFNNDGYLDLVCLNNLRSGTSPYSPLETAIVYKGDGSGNFTKVWESPADYFSAVAVGDIDRDGLCDFVAATFRNGGQDSYDTIYYNTGNFNFDDRTFQFAGPESRATSLVLADVNNDGWLDLIMGWDGTSETKTRLYLNKGGTFSLLDETEFSADAMSFAIGDFDGDGDLDYVAGTSDGCKYYYSTLADDGKTNSKPSAPPSDGFSFSWEGGKLHLNWGAGSDNETPTNLLQYNLKLRDEAGTIISPVGGDVFSECDGFYGNMLTSTWTVLNVPRKTYFYSVQTIDAYGAASAFSPETVVNEKPYPGWDVENVLLSTGCRQYTKDEVLQDFNLKGCVTIDFRVKDFEKNNVTLKNFSFSLDGGNSWTALPEGSGALEGFYSPNFFYSSDVLSSAPKYTFTWNTTHIDDPSVLYSTHTLNARVRFKANDGYTDSDYCVSEAFEIDNEKPTYPGDLSFNGKYTGQSIGLDFGTPSSDDNFSEYIIYYNDKLPVNNVGDSLGEWNSSNDANLASVDFNGASSTTVTGLNENTTYYFAIYAYDNFGNYNPSLHTAAAKTNDIPSMSFVSVQQSTTGTHLVTFTFKGSDTDANSWNYVSYQVRDKFRNYVDVIPSTGNPAYTSPLFFCSTGSVNTFVFNAKKALGEVSYDNALFKLSVTDGIDSSEVSTPLPFTIDTLPPSGITAFKVAAFKSSSVQLQWNLDDTGKVIQTLNEDNFWKYEIWWGTSTGVTNSEPFNCWGPEDESSLGSASATSADVTGLNSGVKYYFRLFVYDAYGNIYSGNEVSQVTGSGPTSWFDSASQVPSGDGTVAIKVFCQHPDHYDIFGRIEYSTTSSDGPWYEATLSTAAEAYYNQTGGYFTAPSPQIVNSQYYQVGTSQNPIDTSTGTWTALYLYWQSRSNIPNARYENVYLKTSVKDINDIRQFSDDITGPFVVDNLDPAVLSCSYSHGDENYGTDSARLSLALNKEISSIDYNGIFISTGSSFSSSLGCDRIYLSTEEFLPSVSSTTLYYHLKESDWRQIAGWSDRYSQIYIHISSAAIKDSVENFISSTTKAIFWTKDTKPPAIEAVLYQQNSQTGRYGMKIRFDEEILSFSTATFQNIVVYLSPTSASKIEFFDGITIDSAAADTFWFYPTEARHFQILDTGLSSLYFGCGSFAKDISGNFNSPISQVNSIEMPITVERTPPSVTDVSPSGTEKIDPTDVQIWAKFSEALYSVSVLNSISVVGIKNSKGEAISENVEGTLNYDSSQFKVEFIPFQPLKYGYKYKVTISTKIEDLSRNNLATQMSYEFETLLDLSAAFSLSTGDATVEISANALSGTGKVVIKLDDMTADIVDAFSKSAQLSDAAHHRIVGGVVSVNVYDSSGNIKAGNFSNDVWISFSYKDDNGDGFVDSESPPVRVASLAIYWLADEKYWIKLPGSTLYPDQKVVKAKINHFSSYALIGSSLFNLENVHPYPVPYRKWEDVNGWGIRFTNMPSEATIEIRDITGNLLKTFSYSDATAVVPGVFTGWENVQLPSGIYLYRVKSGESEVRGKIVIIQ